MEIGYCRKTGKVWSLTSWKDEEDPSVAVAVVKMDPKQPKELYLMRGSEMLWRTGVWHEGGFSSMSKTGVIDFIILSFYNTENETYFGSSPNESSVGFELENSKETAVKLNHKT
ncbi:hypothetical protein Patl1_04463 [Pistacia atlantica]|uniref:Uncharacterized protein n=1 Tax=Pistacia atlantica TaxID=434234 RepID=A0ACC1BVI8_9ROSI|nr:hypothetical protein Patl1_04463 [Pistacia atlantica]